jgi:hypothetical protein
MIRFNVLLVLVFSLVIYAGCATGTHPVAKDVDEDVKSVFVGTWEGEHLDGKGEKVRSWVQKRAADGTYVIQFVHYKEDGPVHTVRKGKWWLEGDRFYEIAPSIMDEPDVYEFEIIGKDEIRFQSLEEDYSFTDKRVEPDETPRFM